MAREPRVPTEQLQALLREAINPRFPAARTPLSVAVIAERAGVSQRTVYRVLEADPLKEPTQPLNRADRILIGIDRHITDVEVVA